MRGFGRSFSSAEANRAWVKSTQRAGILSGSWKSEAALRPVMSQPGKRNSLTDHPFGALPQNRRVVVMGKVQTWRVRIARTEAGNDGLDGDLSLGQVGKGTRDVPPRHGGT